MLSTHLQGCFCLGSSSPHKKLHLPFPFSDERVCSNVGLLKRVSELEHRCPCWTGQEKQERAQTAPLGSVRDLNHFNSAAKHILALIPPKIARQTNTQSPSWALWLGFWQEVCSKWGTMGPQIIHLKAAYRTNFIYNNCDSLTQATL